MTMKVMKVREHIHETKTKKVWYDYHLRLWTLQVVDSLVNNQIGDVSYTPNKKQAIAWLENENS